MGGEVGVDGYEPRGGHAGFSLLASRKGSGNAQGKKPGFFLFAIERTGCGTGDNTRRRPRAERL
jgi:hypothetical protein